MKKNYLILSLASLAIGGVAQTVESGAYVHDKIIPLNKHISNSEKVVKPTQLNANKSTIIWSNDCSDINDFILTNTSVPALDWSVESDPAAIPVTVLSPMASATASNGFLFINSDGIVGNQDNDGTPVNATVRIADTIDLSSYSDVELKFSSNYRWWQEARTVRVSTDLGATWTEFEITNTAGSPDDQNSGNPTIERIDLSDFAGGQSQVLIEFVYFDNDFWAWYWAIDDIQVVEKNANDLEVIKYFAADIENDFEYSMIPLAQVSPMSFGLEIENIGVNDLPNTGFSYNINFSSSSVASAANITNPVTLVAGTLDTLFETTSYTPSAIGNYSYTLTAVSDSTDNDLTNNEASGELEITNDIWAADDGTDGGTYSQLFDEDSTAVFMVGNQFFVQAAATIWSLDIGIDADNLGTSSEIFGQIWKFDGTNWEFIDETFSRTLTPNDNGTIVNVDFSNNGVELLPGDQIIAFAGHFGGGITERVSFRRGGKPGVVRLGLVDGSVNGFAGNNEPPLVRLNFDRASNNVSVQENELSLSLAQNMPNPAKENTVVGYTLVNNADVTLKITDINGKVVATINEGNKASGNHVINIDTKNIAEGVYQYTLTAGANIATKSMVIVK